MKAVFYFFVTDSSVSTVSPKLSGTSTTKPSQGSSYVPGKVIQGLSCEPYIKGAAGHLSITAKHSCPKSDQYIQ